MTQSIVYGSKWATCESGARLRPEVRLNKDSKARILLTQRFGLVYTERLLTL